MAAHTNILSALETKLASFAATNGIDVAWPDTGYTPSTDLYLQYFLLPNEPSVGVSADYEDHRGIFQVDVRSPKTGSNAARIAMADLVLDAFTPGSSESFNGVTVKVQRSYTANEFENSEAWITTPINISYRAFYELG